MATAEERLDSMAERDAPFITELRARPEDSEWKMRACAGRTVRVCFVSETVENVERARKYGLSRTLNARDRQAWLYGFDWAPGKVPLDVAELERELAEKYDR